MYYFVRTKKIFKLIFIILGVSILAGCGNKKNITLEFDFKNNIWSNKLINLNNNFQGETHE